MGAKTSFPLLKSAIGLSFLQHPNFRKTYLPDMILKLCKLGAVENIFSRDFQPYKELTLNHLDLEVMAI